MSRYLLNVSKELQAAGGRPYRPQCALKGMSHLNTQNAITPPGTNMYFMYNSNDYNTGG